jgi:hypothetical protein
MEQPRLKAIYQARRKLCDIDIGEPQVRAAQEGKTKPRDSTKSLEAAHLQQKQ